MLVGEERRKLEKKDKDNIFESLKFYWYHKLLYKLMGQNKMKLYIKQQKVNPPNINTYV